MSALTTVRKLKSRKVSRKEAEARKSNRFTKGDRRSLASLIRRHGLQGAQAIWELRGKGYVSKVTLWKIAKANRIPRTPGRPNAKAVARFEKAVESLDV